MDEESFEAVVDSHRKMPEVKFEQSVEVDLVEAVFTEHFLQVGDPFLTGFVVLA